MATDRKPRRWIERMRIVLKKDRPHAIALTVLGLERYAQTDIGWIADLPSDTIWQRAFIEDNIVLQDKMRRSNGQ